MLFRLEVQADVTSTQRFSLCSETASAATSLSEKSVNASIALDDGAASTRALAGSVLNFKVCPNFESPDQAPYLDAFHYAFSALIAGCLRIYNHFYF